MGQHVKRIETMWEDVFINELLIDGFDTVEPIPCMAT